MPWDNVAPNFGFTTGLPWLPLAPEHRKLAVSLQERDPQSTLSWARRLFAARKESKALRFGDIEFLDAPSPVLAFLRTYRHERVLCVFNMSGNASSFRSALLPNFTPLSLCTGASRSAADALSLSPYAAFFASIA